MPFPIAHGLLGASVVAALKPEVTLKTGKKYLLLGAFLGVLPDFDYLMTLMGIAGRNWHHGFMHSITFGLLVGCLTAVATCDFKWRDAAAYSLALISHPLLDFLFTDSPGIALFSPFSNRQFKLGVRPPLEYDWPSHPLSLKLTIIFNLCLLETLAIGGLLLIVLLVKSATTSDRHTL